MSKDESASSSDERIAGPFNSAGEMFDSLNAAPGQGRDASALPGPVSASAHPEVARIPQPSALSPNLAPQAYDYEQGDNEGDESYRLRIVGRAAQLERELAERTRELAELHEEWATDLKDAAGLTPSASTRISHTESGLAFNAADARATLSYPDAERELLVKLLRSAMGGQIVSMTPMQIDAMLEDAADALAAPSSVARSLSTEQRERVLLAMQDVALTDYSVDSLGQPRHLLECSAGDLLDCVLDELTPSASTRISKEGQ